MLSVSQGWVHLHFLEQSNVFERSGLHLTSLERSRECIHVKARVQRVYKQPSSVVSWLPEFSR